MKKFNIIICILLFTYLQTGYFIQSLALRYAAKRQMTRARFNGREESPLEKFALDELQSEITWEEEGKEFWLKGQLYDIVGTVILEGKTYSYCLNDLHEEEIITSYIDQIKKRSRSDQQKGFNLIFSLQYLEPLSPAMPDFVIAGTRQFPPYAEGVLHRHATIISPPPDSCFI